MKKIIALILCLIMASSAISVFAVELGIFSDVDVTSDEGIAILTLYVEGVVKGYGDGTFGIDKPLTRAEFSRMVNLVFGFDGKGMSDNIFSDVSDQDWYYKDVLTAVKAGFIAGFEDGTFRGNDNVTRQQACSVVNRIIKLEDTVEQVEITDAVSDWAKHDVQMLVNNGYVKVEEGGAFRAVEDMTRGELALLLAQFVDDSDYTVEVPQAPDEDKADNDDKTDKVDKEDKEDKEDNDSTSGSVTKPSYGSSSGSSSNGSSDSSSSGSGESSSEPEEDEPSEPVDNTEVLKNLNDVLDEINDASFSGDEKVIIDLIKGSIEATIAAGNAGEKLSDDYVTVHFGDEISQVKAIYNGMTDKARDAFVNKIAAFDLETLGYLQEYFLE